MPSERWRPAFHKFGFDPHGLGYEVSNQGRVRRNDKILKPRMSKTGYLVVDLCGKTYNLHRVVMLTWRGAPPSSHLEVNHKNFKREDARLRNLEWLTSGDNKRHAAKMRKRLKIQIVDSIAI